MFLIKILAGFAFAWFYKLPQYYANADTWRFYQLSLKETDWLLKDPVAFTKDLFIYGYNNSGNLFSGTDSYWNDLKSNVIVKLMAVMNVLTHNSYYTHIILFNFVFLFGLVGLFRVFTLLFPGKKWLVLSGVFFLPSTLFWCSGIHKDGLILSATGMIVFFSYNWLTGRVSAIKYIITGALLLLFIFSLRNYVALALVPALACWAISSKFKKNPLQVFSIVYVAGLVLFFALPVIYPVFDFPGFIVAKQHEFLALQGGSAIQVQPLQPTFKSFIQYFPTAIDLAFLRPHITEAKNFSYLPAAAEVILFLLLPALWLMFPDRKQKLSPAIYCCFFLGCSILLLVGYTITFSGAIVRYRSFVFPLLITPLLCMVDFSGLASKVLPRKAT